MTTGLPQRVGPWTRVQDIPHEGPGSYAVARDGQGRGALLVCYDAGKGSGPELERRFQRERRRLQLAEATQFPTLLHAERLRQADGAWIYCAALEAYDPRQTLARRLQKKGPFAERELLEVAHEIGRGLLCLQQHQIHHGRLHPESVAIGKQGLLLQHPLLAWVEQALYPDQPSAVINHAAPERIHGRPGDLRSDIFSLGAILYTLSTGHEAFGGDGMASMGTDLLEQMLPDPRERRPDLSDGMVRVMRRASAPRPEERYHDAISLLQDIEAVRAGRAPSTVEQATIRPATPNPPTAEAPAASPPSGTDAGSIAAALRAQMQEPAAARKSHQHASVPAATPPRAPAVSTQPAEATAPSKARRRNPTSDGRRRSMSRPMPRKTTKPPGRMIALLAVVVLGALGFLFGKLLQTDAPVQPAPTDHNEPAVHAATQDPAQRDRSTDSAPTPSPTTPTPPASTPVRPPDRPTRARGGLLPAAMERITPPFTGLVPADGMQLIGEIADPVSGTLDVELDGPGAIADAVLIEQAGQLSLLDDARMHFEIADGWAVLRGEGFGRQCRVAGAEAAGPAHWRVQVVSDAPLQIYASWGGHPDANAAARYRISSEGERFADISVDQRRPSRSDIAFDDLQRRIEEQARLRRLDRLNVELLAVIPIRNGQLAVDLHRGTRAHEALIADGLFLVGSDGQVRVIDNSDANFSRSEDEWKASKHTAFGESTLYSWAEEAWARWSFDDLPPDLYRVYSSWSSSDNRCAQARYQLDADGQSWRSVPVDQRKQPRDRLDRTALPAPLQELAAVTLSGDALSVTGTADDGRLCADAVLLLDEDDDSWLIDNGQAGFSASAGWTRAKRAAFGNGPLRQTQEDATATWHFQGLAPGRYRVFASWSPGDDRSAQGRYRISSGGKLLDEAVVDQRQAPESDIPIAAVLSATLPAVQPEDDEPSVPTAEQPAPATAEGEQAGKRAESGRPAPLGYWRFDDDPPGQVRDHSGNDLHLALTPGSEHVAGHIGRALRLGGEDTRATPVQGKGPALPGAFTAAAWVQIRDFDNQGHVICRTGQGGQRGWSLNVESDKRAYLRIAIGPKTMTFTRSERLPTDRWIHIAGSYRPGRDLRFFVDGRLVNTDDSVPDSHYEPDLPLTIGDKPTGDHVFQGSIDEVLLFDVALDAGQVQAIMQGP